MLEFYLPPHWEGFRKILNIDIGYYIKKMANRKLVKRPQSGIVRILQFFSDFEKSRDEYINDVLNELDELLVINGFNTKDCPGTPMLNVLPDSSILCMCYNIRNEELSLTNKPLLEFIYHENNSLELYDLVKESIFENEVIMQLDVFNTIMRYRKMNLIEPISPELFVDTILIPESISSFINITFFNILTGIGGYSKLPETREVLRLRNANSIYDILIDTKDYFKGSNLNVYEMLESLPFIGPVNTCQGILRLNRFDSIYRTPFNIALNAFIIVGLLKGARTGTKNLSRGIIYQAMYDFRITSIRMIKIAGMFSKNLTNEIIELRRLL